MTRGPSREGRISILDPTGVQGDQLAAVGSSTLTWATRGTFSVGPRATTANRSPVKASTVCFIAEEDHCSAPMSSSGGAGLLGSLQNGCGRSADTGSGSAALTTSLQVAFARSSLACIAVN